MHATCIKIGAKHAEAQLNKATTTSFDLPPVSLFGRLGRWPETDLKENRCSVSPSLKRLGLSSPSRPHCCDAQRRWSLMASLLGICRQIRRRDSFMLVLFFFLSERRTFRSRIRECQRINYYVPANWIIHLSVCQWTHTFLGGGNRSKRGPIIASDWQLF